MKNFKKKTFLLLTMSSVIGSTMTASAGWVHFRKPPFESDQVEHYSYFTDDNTMLVNTTTPDGRIVDANGYLVGSADGLNYIESYEHNAKMAKLEGHVESGSVSDIFGTSTPTMDDITHEIKETTGFPEYIIDICAKDIKSGYETVARKTFSDGVTIYSVCLRVSTRGDAINYNDTMSYYPSFAVDANGNPYTGPAVDNEYYFENGYPADGVKAANNGYYYNYEKGICRSRNNWSKVDGKIYHFHWVDAYTHAYIDPYEWSYGGYPMQLNSDASLNNIAGVHDVSVNSSEMSSEVQQAIKNSIENINTRSEDKCVYTIIDQLNKPIIKFDGIPLSSGWAKGFNEFTRFAGDLSFDGNNNLTSIDLSNHYALECLTLKDTFVTSLDCTNNINLSYISVLGSTGVTSIKLSTCGGLVRIVLPSLQAVARDMATGQIIAPYKYGIEKYDANTNVLFVNAVGQTIVIS